MDFFEFVLVFENALVAMAAAEAAVIINKTCPVIKS